MPIAGYQRQVLELGLSHQQPVERIAMVRRQGGSGKPMPSCNLQLVKANFRNGAQQRRILEAQLTPWRA